MKTYKNKKETIDALIEYFDIAISELTWSPFSQDYDKSRLDNTSEEYILKESILKHFKGGSK